jgi:phthiocerol/phenolphthiocerol synthesis type-I polyketide synthase E
VRAEDAVDPAAWGEHLCRPVRFATALGELLSRPRLALLEVGPGRTLSRLARRHPACTEDRGVTASMRASTDALPDEAVLMTALGRLWVAGVEVDWNAFSSGQTRRRVGLPTYPFERQRYWADAGHSFSPVTAAPPETSSGYRRPDLATPFLAPRDETEAALAGIWQRVLGIARVGVHDSFLELGGDSLLAAQVISRVREEMAVDLPAHHVFTADTLAELAPLVRQLAAGQREAERLKSELLAALEELSEDEVESELTRRAVIEIGGDR